MNRREFLQYASYMAAGSILPEMAWSASSGKRSERILVLVELKGANDGFNTLVPFSDSLYYDYRPRIAVKERQLIKLEQGKGMHPHFKVLDPIWDQGNLAWIQGVGYPNGILSHFRSLDVWETASTANQVLEDGWLSQVLPGYKKGLHGIALNQGQALLGPLKGRKVNTVTMESPKHFLNQIRIVIDTPVVKTTPALAHVTQTQHQLYAAGEQIMQKMGKGLPKLPANFSKGVFGHSLESVAQMILSGIDAPVYKVTQDGFDTHSNQRKLQDHALYELTHGLASFAQAMQKAGLWNNVLVVTYSEFGRRVKENRSAGTDHGTANTHFAMGGQVKGGIYGQHPDLSKLDVHGNVRHTTDFRSIYGTIAQRWWGKGNPWSQYGVLPFV